MTVFVSQEVLDRARDNIVREWRNAGRLDLLDLAPAHRERILNTTKPGWDRHFTIRESTWTYDDLDTDAQGRINCVLLNREHAKDHDHDLY